MRGWLFAAFILAIVLAVLITVIGLLANWGIWIKSEMVEAGKKLPHLGKLVAGVLLAFVGLAIELGRRWFIARKEMEELPKVYLNLLGAAIIMPTTKEEEVDNHFRDVLDHFNDSYADRNEELKHIVRESMSQAVASAKSTRYRGARPTRVVSEVWPTG